MLSNHIRLRNKILQILYRPEVSRRKLFSLSEKTIAILDEIDSGIEKQITPLLEDLFENNSR